MDEANVFVGCTDKNMYAYKKSDGSFSWKYTAESDLSLITPVVSNGCIYLIDGSKKLVALHKADGGQKWVYSATNFITKIRLVQTIIKYILPCIHRILQGKYAL